MNTFHYCAEVHYPGNDGIRHVDGLATLNAELSGEVYDMLRQQILESAENGTPVEGARVLITSLSLVSSSPQAAPPGFTGPPH